MRQKQGGFTLLELSISIVIISVIATAGLTLLASSLDTRQANETEGRLRAIQEALLKYRQAFDRIPCPADATLAQSSSQFGIEAAEPGTCLGGAPAANFDASVDDGGPVAGAVPTKTLQLPEDFAFDGYGRRILYAVDTRMTLTPAVNVPREPPFRTYKIADTTVGDLIVRDAAGNARTTKAIYVLVSFGKNGHGAYPRQGGATRVTRGSINVAELENCDCGNTGTTTGFDEVFIQKGFTSNPTDQTDQFDDSVVFGTRADLVGNFE